MAHTYGVFLPRELPLDLLIFTCVLLSALLFYVFYEKGGKIQKIVLDKRGTKFIRSACIIDFFYAFILLYFKQYNDINVNNLGLCWFIMW